MTNPRLLPAASAFILASVSAGQAATSAADRKFVAMVSQGGMFEVKAGELAANQGSTQDIKDQGTTEAHDHRLVGKALQDAASEAGISFPGTLNASFTKQLDDLKSQSGLAFDTAYLHAMQVIHSKDGAAFATEAKSGSNAALVAFAAETHRIVLRHIGEITAVGPAH